jgi:segregation and condensation protein A
MSAEPHDYRVELDAFRGPLDLLLYLVKREEVDVRDVPVARIAEQFKQYLDVIRSIDVERAGDFLVMAATLMEIKSKLLLPRPEEMAEEEEDPRQELVQQLLQYKRFKDAAAALEELAERQGLRMPRQTPAAAASPREERLEPVELWDLVSAFGRLMRETLTSQTQDVVEDHTPQHLHMEAILARLARRPRLPFAAVFEPPHTRSRLTGLFLAVLELTKGRRIIPEQEGAFGEIWLTLAAPGQAVASHGDQDAGGGADTVNGS